MPAAANCGSGSSSSSALVGQSHSSCGSHLERQQQVFLAAITVRLLVGVHSSGGDNARGAAEGKEPREGRWKSILGAQPAVQ